MCNRRRFFFALVAAAVTVSTASPQDWGRDDHDKIKHVLSISIDGMHAVDFLNCSNGIGGSTGPDGGAPYCPALAALGTTGISYQNAALPSHPIRSGFNCDRPERRRTQERWRLYDVAYRSSAGAARYPNRKRSERWKLRSRPSQRNEDGFEEGIDIDQNYLNGGNPSAGNGYDGTASSIDFKKLPRDPYQIALPFIRGTSFAITRSLELSMKWRVHGRGQISTPLIRL